MDEERTAPDEARGPQADAEPDRQVEPVDAEQPPRLPFPVVGIGASAGGLEAVGEFLDAMRPDGGMAFVLVQHLPPDRESLMVEILARRTAMLVAEVQDGMAVAPDHVYVIRPGHRLTIRDGRLHLGPQLGTSRASNRPIDDFFKSLAEEQRERAVAVVMSGMGSNGAAGAQAIKAVGGLCIAQDPDSAQFPSMPRHLIDAGYADYILRPADIPDVLTAYAEHPYATGGREADAEPTLDRERHHLREILAVLRTRTGKDFSGYKKPTLLRRVQRRMGLTRLTTLGEYARLLRQGPGEVTALADDLLIHVTGFFRDPEAWEALRRKVIAPLVEAREPGASVRAWVTACSSGEEAYSLAMLLVEEAERVRVSLDIKVFATDLADRTLAQARAGLYPGGIESEIPPERLGRFFTREDEIYRVRPELRDRVVFAPQNILQDPPFSRLDIAACRNLLIYLEPEVQQRVLGLLHFGLRDGGALFLGSSETVAGAEELFEPIDKKARIFRRFGPTRHGAVEFPMPHSMAIAAEVGGLAQRLAGMPRPWARREGERSSLADLTRRTILEAHTPPAVTVDRDGRIVFYHGDTRPFLQQLTGEPTRELMLLAREGVRGVARAAMHGAAATGERASAIDGWVDLEPGRRTRVAVTASPLVSDDAPGEGIGYFVISFEQWGEFAPPTAEGPADGVESVDELRRLRAELQGTIEELQTSNEELKASHEEVVSVNEEYQSANEELETSKEEMQSLNEELSTVNAQLRAKMEELQATSGDLASLLASTDIAVLFLDTDFRIRRYTAAVRDLLDLIATDVGRPLAALARRFDDPHLDADARSVLERLVPAEREVSGHGDRHFLRRVLPYRTGDNRIDGVVVTFVDITARRRAEVALRESEEKYRALFNSMDEGYCIIQMLYDAAGRPVDWRFLEVNPAFEKHNGLTNATGRTIREMVPDIEPKWAEIYGRVATTGESLRFEESSPTLDGRVFDLYAFRVGEPDGRKVAVLFINITGRKQHERRQAFLLELSDALRPLADPASIQAEACRLLGEHLGADRAYFVEMDEARGPTRARRDYARGDSPSPAGEYRIVDFGWAISVMRGGRTLVIPDVGRSEIVPEADRLAMAAVRIAAHVNVPLVKDGVLVGAVSVTEPRPREWDPAEVELIREVAERMWAAVERAKAEAALRASDERQAFLLKLSDALRSHDDRMEIQHVAMRMLGEQLGATRAFYFLAEPAGGGDWTHIIETDYRRDPGMPSHVGRHSMKDFGIGLFEGAEHGKVVAVGDVTRVPLLTEAEVRRYLAIDVVAFINVPLIKRLRFVAGIGVHDAAPRDWKPSEIELIREVAERTWAAVERARSESARARLQALFDATLSSISDFAYAFDRDGRFVFVNQPLLDLWELTLEDAVGKDFHDLGYPADLAARLRQEIEEVFLTKCGLTGEMPYTGPTGQAGHHEYIFRPVLADDGTVTMVVGSTRDVTARGRAEAALRASEERLRAVASNLPNGAAFVVGHDLRYALAGGTALGPAGLTPAVLEGKTIAEAIGPGLAAEYEPQYRRALAGETLHAEHASHGRHYITHLAPLRDADGAVLAALAVSYDITDRVRAEAAAKESGELFRLLLENVRDYGIFFMDQGMRVAGWWEGAERLLGFQAEDVLGTDAGRFLAPEDRDSGQLAREIREAAETGRASEEGWLVRKDGTRFWASGAVTALRDPAGGLRGFVKIFRDQTEARATEAAVREARDRLRLALEAARMGIWLWEVHEDVHSRDANLNRLLGLEAVETRQSFAEFLAHIHPDDREVVSSAFHASVSRGQPLNIEFRVVWPDGAVCWLRDQGDVFGDAEGNRPRLAGACVDVTDLKEAEAANLRSRDELERRVAERTEDLARVNGALQAGMDAQTELLRRLVTAQEDERRRVARDLHDGLGQEITSLILGLGALGQSVPEGSAGRERLREVEETVARIGREAHDLAVDIRPTALDDLGLAPALSAYIARWSDRTGVAADFQPTGVDGDRFPPEHETTVYRIVQEALNNVARHAGAGRVSVILERHGGDLTALVEDDGRGFDPAQAGSSGRRGLGLLGMRERVNLVGGALLIDSGEGQGTTVRARIPLGPPAKEAGDGG